MTTWTIEIGFDEDTDYTQAIATLRAPNGRELRGLGQARRNPEDRSVPAIGEEVAGARALSSLAHELHAKPGGLVFVVVQCAHEHCLVASILQRGEV